jgi:DNA-directed RNA polymerase subunit RPC12/RpoP
MSKENPPQVTEENPKAVKTTESNNTVDLLRAVARPIYEPSAWLRSRIDALFQGRDEDFSLCEHVRVNIQQKKSTITELRQPNLIRCQDCFHKALKERVATGNVRFKCDRCKRGPWGKSAPLPVNSDNRT